MTDLIIHDNKLFKGLDCIPAFRGGCAGEFRQADEPDHLWCRAPTRDLLPLYLQFLCCQKRGFQTVAIQSEGLQMKSASVGGHGQTSQLMVAQRPTFGQS